MSESSELALTPEEEAEFQEALANWFPYWRKPMTIADWGKLVSQRKSFAISSIESHAEAIRLKAPLWLRQMTARSAYTNNRKYARVRDRAEREKIRVCRNLAHALGLKPFQENLG